MLTKGEFDFINNYIQQSCAYWIIPLDWDKDLNLARPTKSKWKRFFCIFNLFVGFAILAFSVSTLHMSVADYKRTHRLDGVVIHVLLILSNYAVITLQLTTILYMEDLIWLLNNTMLFNQKLGYNESRRSFLDSNSREKYIKAFQWITNAGLTAKAMLFFAFREHEGYPYSALPSGYKTVSTFLIFCIVESWAVIMALRLSFTVLYLVSFTFLSSAIFWLRFDWPPDTFVTASNAYKSMFILNSIHNNTLSRLFIPTFKFVAGTSAMICIFIAINLRSQVHPMLLALSPFTILVGYILLISGSFLMSNVYKYSIQMKLNLTRSNIMRIQGARERKLNSIVLNSMSPIKCCVGNLYFMEKKAKGTLVDQLIQGTTTLLLTFKK